MAQTEFQVVSWQPRDVVTNDKLDAMVNNDQWLRDNTPRARYSTAGVSRDTGIRIASGIGLITAGGKLADKSVAIRFNNYFSESCSPVVTTGIVSSAQRQLFVTIDGPGSNLLPTRDGFTAWAHSTSTNAKNKFTKNIYISWIAVGF